jgi:hypothetical protein
MTDTGSAYRSLGHAIACRALKLRHLRTQLYRRAPTARAERFIRTLLAERAPGAIYRHKRQRTAALSVWLDHCNTRESHGTFSPQPRPPALRN